MKAMLNFKECHIMKELGSWASASNNDNKPWGRRWTLPYHKMWYGKVEAGLTPTPDVQEGRRKKRRSFLLARAKLSSYLYRPCTMCVNPSMLGVVSTPPQYCKFDRPRSASRQSPPVFCCEETAFRL